MIKKLLTLSLSVISIAAFSQKITVTPSIGFGWRTAEMPDGLTPQEKTYLRGLKSGTNFDISAYYHLKGPVGIGARYSLYTASSSTNFTVDNGFGSTFSSILTTKDKITFVGPSLVITNLTEDTKHKLFLGVSLGYLSYSTVTEGIEGKGSTLGAEIDATYQYEIHKNILIGPKLGLSAGTLSKMKFDGVTYEFGEDEKEGLQRVSLSAAVTFRF